jgi:predicted transposase/invertase (TIGR01784 family)
VKKTVRPADGIYQNLLNDFGFKHVFTQSKFLIAFLNELLNGVEKIETVEYLNSECLGKTEADRRAVFDILCRNDKGEKILLEMQNLHQEFFLDRSIYYSSFLVQQQGKKGEWDFNLKSMYVIGILNFIPDELKPFSGVVCHAQLLDKKTKQIVSDKLNFIYVSLPKFRKRRDELTTQMDFWLYTLIHSRKMFNPPKSIVKNELFNDLLFDIRLKNLNEVTMEVYKNSEQRFNYDLSMYATGHLKEGLKKGMQAGLRKGLRRGRQEGREDEQQQIALSALKLGYSSEEVAALTGLTLEQLKELPPREW